MKRKKVLIVVVYSMHPIFGCQSKVFDKEGVDNLQLAMQEAQSRRQQGENFVCYATENTDMVGKVGVDSVENGKLPNGDNYGWKKRRR